MRKRYRFTALITLIAMLFTGLGVFTAHADTSRFADISETNKAWYYDAVMYVAEKGLMNGTGNNRFSPFLQVTRSQMVQILFNMEGLDQKYYSGETGFADSDNAWYSPAVKWARESGVTSGTSADTFSPDKPLTRQELVKFICSYSGYKGFDTERRSELDSFADSEKTASWARSSIEWAVAEGIISGAEKGNALYLNPTNIAQRCELATIIMNYNKGLDSEPELLLRFAAMSDVHIGDTNTEQSLKRTLSYINTLGEMDAFMVSGDLTNTTASTKNSSQIERFNDIFEEEISYDTSMVYSLGPSHDLPYSSSGLEHRALYAEVLSDRFFETDDTPAEIAALGVRHAVINGFHFFSVDHEGAGFCNEAMVWLVAEVEKAVAEDPEKPFFISTHVPEMPHINALLANYPQAVCFTGHLHNSVSREDSIRQDNGYTNIHCGGMNYYRVDGYNRFNENPFLNLGNIYDFAQAVYVEVYSDNSVKLQRLDTYNSAFIGEPWLLTADNFGAYTEKRFEEGSCYFEEDCDMEVLALDNRYLKVSFDPCVKGMAGAPLYYMIELLMPVYGGNYETVAHVELSSQEVFYPNGEGIPDLYYTYTFEENEGLDDFAVRVTAFDCRGQSANALICNGGSYDEIGVGNVSLTVRDFTPEEELTGMVTDGLQDIEFIYGDSVTSKFTEGYTMGVRFCPTIAFTDVELRCSSWGDTVGALNFALYRWQNDYETTVAGEPVDTYTLADFKGSTVYNVFDGEYEYGEYLIEITTPDHSEGVGLYHYTMQGTNDAYISYENGVELDTNIYLSWTNTKTCTKPYVPMR